MLESPGFLFTILAFLVVLGPLVFVHEYGHYIVGRWCGVKADTFSIGFGRKILGWTDKRGTEWKIGWLPLGGYVQFAGDRDAVKPARRQLAQHARRRTLAQLSRAAGLETRSHRARRAGDQLPVRHRDLCRLQHGLWRADDAPVVGAVEPGSAAEAADLRVGDRIVAINGGAIEKFDDIPMAVAFDLGKPAQLAIQRGGERIDVLLRPRVITETDRFGNKGERAVIGIRSGEIALEPVNPLAAVQAGAAQTWGIVRLTGDILGQFLTGQRSVKEMGGPLKIAKQSGEMATLGLSSLIFFVAFVSINLGFINLLPLPMLDGGHLLFYGYEAIRRRPAPPQAQEWAFRFGFAVIVTLMLVVTFNDLGSIGVWDRIARLIG